MPENNRLDFHFRCQVYASSPAGKLLRYLQKSEDLELSSLKDKILPALAAYWLPYAHKYDGGLKAAELKQSALRARRLLRERIFDLEEEFGLESDLVLERQSYSQIAISASEATTTGEAVESCDALDRKSAMNQPSASPPAPPLTLVNGNDFNKDEDDELIGSIFQ